MPCHGPLAIRALAWVVLGEYGRLLASFIYFNYQGVFMDRGDYSSSTNTHVESQHRDATPEETRKIGLIKFS